MEGLQSMRASSVLRLVGFWATARAFRFWGAFMALGVWGPREPLKRVSGLGSGNSSSMCFDKVSRGSGCLTPILGAHSCAVTTHVGLVAVQCCLRAALTVGNWQVLHGCSRSLQQLYCPKLRRQPSGLQGFKQMHVPSS